MTGFDGAFSEDFISERWGGVSRWEGHFKHIARQLTIEENGLIRFGSRVVPPQSLHRRILEVSHQSYYGMDSALPLVQSEFFWPGMRSNVEAFVKDCEHCGAARFSAIDTTDSWPKCEQSWKWVRWVDTVV